MNRKYKVIFLISVLTNLVWASAFVYERHVRASSPYRADANTVPNETEATVPSVNSSELKNLYLQMRAAGIADTVVKRMLANDLRQTTSHALQYEYWRPASIRDTQERLSRYQLGEKNRAAIMEAFGNSAIDDEGFVDIFRPYAREFPFLSSQKQLDIERISARRQRAFLDTVDTGHPAQARAGYQSVQVALNSELEKILTPTELFEYQLRASPIAQRLLNSGFNFSEKEFREAYQSLTTSAQNVVKGQSVDPAVQSAISLAPVTESLKAALGNQRFEEYAKRQDPTYAMLQTLSDAYGVNGSDMEAAYQEIVGTAQTVSALRRTSPILSPDAGQALRSALEKRDQKLKELLGREAFEVASRSLPSLANSYSMPVSTRPPMTQSSMFQGQ